jgi:hypothetical protein
MSGGIRYHNFNFDTRGRENFSSNPSTNCKIKFQNRIRNVCSVEMTSIELPNSIMLFSATRGNNSFNITIPGVNDADGNPITDRTVTLNEGNYVAQDFEVEVHRALGAARVNTTETSEDPIQFNISTLTGKSTFTHTGGANFDLDFNTSSSTRSTNWGFGYYAGFREKNLAGASEYTSSGVINIIGERYYLLQISPKMNNLVSAGENGSYPNSNLFTKVVLVGSVFTIVTENDNNSMNKLLYLDNPITIDELEVKLTDFYGDVVDINECDFSFTLRVAELTHLGMPANLNNY